MKHLAISIFIKSGGQSMEMTTESRDNFTDIEMLDIAENIKDYFLNLIMIEYAENTGRVITCDPAQDEDFKEYTRHLRANKL